ncbi:MAG TPA: DUF3618 domain-containing protein [Dermatophilaceae bacterium]|nr:DUF3618 domain-containing protein [Dermatophilaceae bacterium]
MSSTQPSITELEADIAARRDRLARTVDELTARAQPKAIMQRQKDSAKARFADVTTTPEGDLRVERIAAAVAVLAVVVVLAVLRRRRG